MKIVFLVFMLSAISHALEGDFACVQKDGSAGPCGSGIPVTVTKEMFAEEPKAGECYQGDGRWEKCKDPLSDRMKAIEKRLEAIEKRLKP